MKGWTGRDRNGEEKCEKNIMRDGNDRKVGKEKRKRRLRQRKGLG